MQMNKQDIIVARTVHADIIFIITSEDITLPEYISRSRYGLETRQTSKRL